MKREQSSTGGRELDQRERIHGQTIGIIPFGRGHFLYDVKMHRSRSPRFGAFFFLLCLVVDTQRPDAGEVSSGCEGKRKICSSKAGEGGQEGDKLMHKIRSPPLHQ